MKLETIKYSLDDIECIIMLYILQWRMRNNAINEHGIRTVSQATALRLRKWQATLKHRWLHSKISSPRGWILILKWRRFCGCSLCA